MTAFNVNAFAGNEEVAAVAARIAEQVQKNSNAAAVVKDGKSTLTADVRSLAALTVQHGLQPAAAYTAVYAALSGMVNTETGEAIIPKGSIKGMSASAKGWNKAIHDKVASGSDITAALEFAESLNMKEAQNYAASDETKELNEARKRLKAILDAKLPTKGKDAATAEQVNAVCDELARIWQVGEAEEGGEARTGTEG